MKLTIIIPCYNEKAFISELLSRVKQSPVGDKEIIIVDDGSDDGTTDILRERLEREVYKIIYHAKNLGKGAAIRSALPFASGAIILFQDADLEYDPRDYPKLIAPILEGKADVVYGSRFSGEGPHRIHLFWHYIGNKFLTTLSNMFTNLNLTDMETGYKVFRHDFIKDIHIDQNRFGIEPEITAKIARKKARVYEVGISYYGRSYSEGKKIDWKDAHKAVFVILRYGILR